MTHKIMVVDDDSATRRMVRDALQRHGHQVLEAPDGKTARELMKREHPRVVLQDLVLPDADGFELVGELRALAGGCDVSILAFSGFFTEIEDARVSSVGFDDIITKPIAPSRLVPLIEAHLPAAVPRAVRLNHGLAKRCSVLASELTVLTGVSEAVLEHRDIDVALDEALAECFDAGGISLGALYLLDPDGSLRMRSIGEAADDDLATLYGNASLLRDVVTSGRELAVPSETVSRELVKKLLGRARATAMLMVPLVHLDATLGSLLMIVRGRELDHGEDTFAHGVATQISHVLALARAYAGRETAERRAAEHAAILDAVLESAPDFVANLDLDGTIRFINRALPPSTPASLVGTSIFDLPIASHDDALRKAFIRLEATGEAQGYEAATVRDGEPAWFSTRLGPIKANGKPVGAVLVARDVTEAKQTELHLMVTDRMASVGTLAAGVAHEINNPLASVIANLDMALQDVLELGKHVELPRDLPEELQDARTAADRVREIVRDLKIFSRTEEEHQGPVDVEQVLESTIRMAWNELRHRARLVKHYTPVPEVDANESRLGQVFLNLIMNAAHAIPPGNYETNTITISTSTDAGGRVVVAIGDTGCGIPDDVRPRMFTPFFTTKPVGVGTGLGLVISHRIVTQFGGTLTYDTEVGKGTEFRLTLPPAATRERVPESTIPPKSSPTRRGTVLVIDDEEPLVQAIRRYLSIDHDVTAVFSGTDALDRLGRGERYDVILCDLMMPQVTGMKLHDELLRIDPTQAARIVFLTGGAFTPAAREFLDGVPNRRLEKPFDLKALRKLVNDWIR